MRTLTLDLNKLTIEQLRAYLLLEKASLEQMRQRTVKASLEQMRQRAVHQQIEEENKAWIQKKDHQNHNF